MSLFSPIHHTFGPMADSEQCSRALRMLFIPWRWKNGRSTEHFREELSARLGGEVFLFGAGREALCALLQTLQLKPGEEILITRNDQPAAKLIGQQKTDRPAPKLGTLKGTVLYMAPDFNAPLEEFKDYM